MYELTEREAREVTYHGNTVAYIYQKMLGYRNAIGRPHHQGVPADISKSVEEELLFFARVAGWGIHTPVPGLTRIVVRNTYWACISIMSDLHQLAAEMRAYLAQHDISVCTYADTVCVRRRTAPWDFSYVRYAPEDPDSALAALIHACAEGARLLKGAS